MVMVLLPDGTLAEYSYLGRLRNDYTATTLSGGYFDGSTFAAESIVGVHGTRAFILSTCLNPATGNPYFIAPSTNNQVSSLKNRNTETGINVEAFPNPLGNQDLLNIKIQVNEVQDIQLQLVDATGKTWKYQQMDIMNGNTQQLDMSSLPSGIYFLSVKTNTDKKVIKIVR